MQVRVSCALRRGGAGGGGGADTNSGVFHLIVCTDLFVAQEKLSSISTKESSGGA